MKRTPEANCRYAGRLCEKNGCFLGRQAEHQSKSGGSNAENSNIGPFWEMIQWQDYVRRTKKFASEQGCAEEVELTAKLEELTAEKAQNRELETAFPSERRVG